MIKGINTLSWVAILCGILGFDGSRITTAENGLRDNSVLGKSNWRNSPHKLAQQQHPING
jgi:hypothetical protein